MRGTSRMRFFSLALLLMWAAGAGSFTSQSPHPIVIFVHGRGQLGQDTAQLRREWKRDLDSSLMLVGMPALRDDEVRLAWYADVLDPDSESSCAREAVSSDSLGFGEVARGFLALLSTATPKDESRELRGVMGDLLYALDDSKRCAAERRVGGVIDAALLEHRPVVVVAYSLGSLVTYGYLRSWPADKKSTLRLVTVGSPLGLRVIRELVFGGASERLQLPQAVTTVENVYDLNDLLSAPLTGVLSGAHVRDDVTRASERDEPHNLTRYLRDPATGAAVMRAICGATNNDRAGCVRR